MGLFIQKSLLNGDSRFLKNIVMVITLVMIWIDNVDAATTEINADVSDNGIPINIKHDTVGNPISYKTANSDRRYPDEVNPPNLVKSGGKPKLRGHQDSSNAKTKDAHKSAKSAEPDKEHLTLTLPQFKQILKNAMTSQYRKGPNKPVFILDDEDDKNTRNNGTTTAEKMLPYSGEITNTKMDEKTVENDVMTTPADVKHMSSATESVNIFKNLFPPHVSVIVTKPKGRHRNSAITVPLETDMTVWNALLSATRTYMDTHPDDENNPFNLRINYDRKQDCFVTIKAVGIQRRKRNAWIITVKDMNDQVVYRGQCIPGSDVILRPSSVLQLTYKRIRSRKFASMLFSHRQNLPSKVN